MKYIPCIAGGLLCFLFLFAVVGYFLKQAPKKPAALTSPVALFFGAIGPTGFMTFVKVCEAVGAVLVAIPKTRNFGLLILVPIIVNIVAFHTFIGGWGDAKAVGMVNVIVLLALYLIWVVRKQIRGLLN